MYRSTPSLHGSRSTLNSTTAEKNPGSGILKLALVYINDHIEETELEQSLTFKDFDSLTSEQMLKIVTFLLRNVIGDKKVIMEN